MSPQSNSTPGLSLPSPTLEASGSVQQPSNSVPSQSVQGQIQGIINPPMPEVQSPQLVAEAVVPSSPISSMPQASIVPQQQPVVSQPPSSPVPQAIAPVLALGQNPSPQQIPQAQDEELNLDDDALDEEWVNKAKSVAEQYQADPYMASKALSKVKAEYLQRRYGKQIKVSD